MSKSDQLLKDDLYTSFLMALTTCSIAFQYNARAIVAVIIFLDNIIDEYTCSIYSWARKKSSNIVKQ